ncbi:hypothetical protein PTKIN_Ptkin13bG0256700 [Pterospermum kingtungense]
MLWQMWLNQNQCFHDKVCTVPAAMLNAAIRMVTDFEMANPLVDLSYASVQPMWAAPHAHFVKINSDASFQCSGGDAILRVVIRDCSGDIHLTAIHKVAGVYSALQVELLGIKYGLELAQQGSFQHVILESDCQVALHLIHKLQPSDCLRQKLVG